MQYTLINVYCSLKLFTLIHNAFRECLSVCMVFLFVLACVCIFVWQCEYLLVCSRHNVYLRIVRYISNLVSIKGWNIESLVLSHISPCGVNLLMAEMGYPTSVAKCSVFYVYIKIIWRWRYVNPDRSVKCACMHVCVLGCFIASSKL